MAERLKQLREGRGLSHDKLSKALADQYGVKISPDSLINYEVADANHTKAYKNQGMRVEYLRCLANFYQVSADYLIGITDVKSQDPSIATIVKSTGLSERSIYRLRNFIESSDDSHFSYYDKYGIDSAYALEMVEEFIDFALDYRENFYLPFDTYLSFRQLINQHNEDVAKVEEMDPPERSHLSAKVLRDYRDSVLNGFYPLLPADAADFFRKAFCDDFNEYLKANHPLEQPSKKIRGFAMVEEEDLNGND